MLETEPITRPKASGTMAAPACERRVAERVLQELRDREDRAEEAEERDADRGRRDGEARVAEEGQVEQRVLRAQLPGDEQRGERGEAGEAAEGLRGSASRPPAPR